MRGRAASSWIDALAYTAGFVREWVGLLARPFGRGALAWPIAIAPAGGTPARRAGGFASLRRAIFGYSKREVARVLGPPPAAAVSALPSLVQSVPDFWTADTWYYPFDPNRCSAVVVQFHRGRVKRVEFLGGLA